MANDHDRRPGGDGNADLMALARGEGLNVMTTLLSRTRLAAFLGKQYGGKRDMYDALGYNRVPLYEDYYAVYKRMHIARRIVDAPAEATWRAMPDVRQNQDLSQLTDFEQKWRAIARRLNLLAYLERVDRLAGIGRYGVMMLGVRSNTPFSKPLTKAQFTSGDSLAYVGVYGELGAQVTEWDWDPYSPRYGRPLMYKLDIGGADLDEAGAVSVAPGIRALEVHWTRCIHIAEGLLDSEVLGTPRLESVHNLFEDLMKVVGGSAEMFWQGADRGLQLDINPDFQMTDAAKTELATEVDEYMHKMRRYIRTQGVNVKPLGGDVADPSGPFNVILSLIAGATGIPKRILVGSEQGELASTQDTFNWAQRVKERQKRYAEPMMLRKLIDRLMWLGILPSVADYDIKWPEQDVLNVDGKARIMRAVASSARSLAGVQGDATSIVTPDELREYIGLPPLQPAQDTSPGMPPETPDTPADGTGE